jgi:hypothetical protein
MKIFSNAMRCHVTRSILCRSGLCVQGFKVTVLNSWVEDNNIEIWLGRNPEQLAYLIPRELMEEFNEFQREPWVAEGAE